MDKEDCGVVAYKVPGGRKMREHEQFLWHRAIVAEGIRRGVIEMTIMEALTSDNDTQLEAYIL